MRKFYPFSSFFSMMPLAGFFLGCFSTLPAQSGLAPTGDPEIISAAARLEFAFADVLFGCIVADQNA